MQFNIKWAIVTSNSQKADDVIVFDFMTSSSFLCIVTPKTSNFSNFQLKFGLGVDFGTLI